VLRHAAHPGRSLRIPLREASSGGRGGVNERQRFRPGSRSTNVVTVNGDIVDDGSVWPLADGIHVEICSWIGFIDD
jgi:hypothetical protein